ncbi:hypothetical protein [Streptomyces sp. NPDC059009]|uniref:hypothetical protein n=1 Tax=Streptomyces sp. NPDC059009 TaxID=3346694 RepID=UPI0036A520E5
MNRPSLRRRLSVSALFTAVLVTGAPAVAHAAAPLPATSTVRSAPAAEATSSDDGHTSVCPPSGPCNDSSWGG